MNILKATKRTSASSGQVNKLRFDGFIPAVLYGGKKSNLNISVKKLHFQDLIKTETFMSKVFDLDIDGSSEKVLPREVAYDPVSDEPIHIDFIRIVKGSKIILEIPVKFVNAEKSPGLKKGGVLNVIRRTIKLICNAKNIPELLQFDLIETDIGDSIKISNIELPIGVQLTIRDRDFVVATIVAPTIEVEETKPEEETAEGEGEGEVSETGGDEKIEDKKEETSETKEIKQEKEEDKK